MPYHAGVAQLTALQNSTFSMWVLGSDSIWSFPTILTLHTIGLGAQKRQPSGCLFWRGGDSSVSITEKQRSALYEPFPPRGYLEQNACQIFNAMIGLYFVKRDEMLSRKNARKQCVTKLTIGAAAKKNAPEISGRISVLLSNTEVGVDLKHFYVGGTLTAPAGTYGIFSGTMTVTANYQ
jgi:hypothetical protein